jgi:glycosyltransferase involved in cell wall biosynthesis
LLEKLQHRKKEFEFLFSSVYHKIIIVWQIEEIALLDMARLKVCVVTHTFLPHVGGIERVVYEQGKRLLKRDYAITVLTSRNKTAKNYVFDGISVQCYESFNFGFRLGIPYSIPKVSSFKTFLQSVISSDLVHVHGHPYLSSLFAAKIAKRYGKPLVLTQHNTFIDYNSIFNQAEKLNDLSIGRENLKAADKIIVVSEATKKYVLSLDADPQKVVLLHNGVDLERFKPISGAREAARRRLDIPATATVAVTVRRLVYKNGIDTLIESARRSVVKNPSLIFLVIGKGPDFNEIKLQVERLGIASNFRLTGFVSDEDLPQYYNAADFFILPSKSGEGLPLVALEAMACGLPLIATDVGGIREILVKGYGRLVKPNNPENLAQASLDFSRIDFSGTKADLASIVRQKHGWDQNVDKLVKIYEELI